MKKNTLRIALFTSLILVGYGCETTKLVSSWSAPQATSTDLKKVLVVTMMGGRFYGTQQAVENATCEQLRSFGVESVSSIDFFGATEFKRLTNSQLSRALSETNFSAILILSLLDKKKEVTHIPGNTYLEPLPVPIRPFYRRYVTIYERVYTPGYYTTSTEYMLDAEIYSLSNDKLIYSGQASSVDPNNRETMMKSFSKIIVNDLQTKGLIEPKK